MPEQLGVFADAKSNPSMLTRGLDLFSWSCNLAVCMSSSLGVGDGKTATSACGETATSAYGKTATSALPCPSLGCWVVTMLASCGEVELEDGSRSTKGVLVGLAGCVACCWLSTRGNGCFLGLPLPLLVAGAAGAGGAVRSCGGSVEGAAGAEPGLAGAGPGLTGATIHDLICRLPSA